MTGGDTAEIAQKRQEVVDVYMAESASTITFLLEQLEILGDRVSGRGKTVRYSPSLLKFSVSLFVQSKKGYDAAAQVLQLPSISTISKIKQARRVHSGLCADMYRNARASLESSTAGGDGILMLDEMKVQAGILFTTSDDMITGFTDEALSFHSLLS